MATKFGNAWYVRKDRIQMFLPLVEDVHLEIDKTGLGTVTATGTTSYVSVVGSGITSYNSLVGVGSQSYNDLINNGMEVGTNPVQALKFDGTTTTLTMNDALSALISNALYGKGGKRTVTFWSAPEDDTTLASSPRLGINENMVLSDSYADGYGFGVETHTSTLNPDVISQSSASYGKHMLTMISTKRKTSTGNESEVEDWGGSGTKINIPTDSWIMTTYLIDHSDSSNYKIEIHMRWYDSSTGNKLHFWRTSSNMNYDDLASLQGRASNQSTIWTVGCATFANGSSVPTIRFKGLIRNIMLYNCLLTDAQQDTMFANGIDPYVATETTNTTPDQDQYDQQFWGMYGVLATNSGVKLEKTLFASHSTGTAASITQNTGRFGIAARDGSVVTVARDEVVEGTSTNPQVSDLSSDLNGFGNEVSATNAIMAIKAAAWRGGIITGDKKLSRTEARAIWGGIINGETDMMKIANTTNPTDLPAGKYITSWDLVHNNGYNTNYPSFLPKYYYRDRLSRSWRMPGSTNNSSQNSITDTEGNTKTYVKTFVNEIFWDKQTRYEKILWTKQTTKSTSNPTNYNQNVADDNNQLDTAGNWQPIYWVIAIYEVFREPTLSSSNFANHIRLTLINNEGNRCAIYHKYRKNPRMGSVTDGTFGGWQFESLNDQFADENGDSVLASEFMSRIYLPHIVIPKLSIPLFHDRISVDYTDMEAANAYAEQSLASGGSLVYFKSTGAENKMVCGNTSTGGVYTAEATSPWVVPEDGWYDFSACFNQQCGDHNYTVTLTVGGKSKSGSIGDYVGGGSVGGAPSSVVVRVVQYLKRGASIAISTSGATCIWIVGHRGTAGYMFSKNLVKGVNVVVANGNANNGKSGGYDPRYSSLIRQDSTDADYEHIELRGIKAIYTRKNYTENNETALRDSSGNKIVGTGTMTWGETSSDVTNTTLTPYDE